MTKKINLSNIPKHVLLLLLCLFAVFPIYWMVVSSLKPLSEILNASLMTYNPTLDNFTDALSSIPLLQMTLNTLIIAFSETAFQLFTALLMCYALTRWKFKASAFILVLMSLTWLVPFQAIMILNYITIAGWNLRNTILGVVLPFSASAFSILTLYSAFRSFPKALIEAAVLDGISEPGILFGIVLPNIKAAVVSLGILLFINAWNEYIWALLVNSNLNQAPIQIGLQSFLNLEGSEWGPLMAAATLSSLPILLIYVALHKQIINANMKRGIK